MLWRTVGALASVAAISGCATQQSLTRDEYLKTTQRVYSDRSPDQVFTAAEKLFRLADGDDFKFAWTDDSMTASRPWSIYLVLAASFGVDNWLVQTKQEADGTHVRVGVTTSASAIAPVVTTGGDWTAGSTPSLPGPPIQGTAIYDVFWARLDYLLGKRQSWMTCEEADARVKSKVTWGDNSQLCNSFNMKDNAPDAPVALK